MLTIDINADLGEHDGDGHAADDALLDVVSSASIACGAHAGSLEVMERTVHSAALRGVSVGAHPSYPDREGFGRREISLSLDAIAASVREQIELLAGCCARAGTSLKYVKPHGALYNRAAKDRDLASLLARCVREIDPQLAVLALPGSEMEYQVIRAGLAARREAFIDRAYMSDGTLVPRSNPGAILRDLEGAALRAVHMIREGTVTTIDGDTMAVAPESLCVHADSANALEMVTLTRQMLEEAGITIRAFA